MSIFSWKVTEEEFKTQVENYSNLKITESYRGISALLVLGLMVLTVVLAKFGVISYDSVYSAIIYVPLAYFIYKGHRWALVLVMLLWTFEKGWQVYDAVNNSTSVIVPIIWWSIFMNYFFNALKIEIAKKKQIIKNTLNSDTDILNNTLRLNNYILHTIDNIITYLDTMYPDSREMSAL